MVLKNHLFFCTSRREAIFTSFFSLLPPKSLPKSGKKELPKNTSKNTPFFKKAGPPDSQIYRATHQLSECLGRMNAHKARCTQFDSIRCWLTIISPCWIDYSHARWLCAPRWACSLELKALSRMSTNKSITEAFGELLGCSAFVTYTKCLLVF